MGARKTLRLSDRLSADGRQKAYVFSPTNIFLSRIKKKKNEDCSHYVAEYQKILQKRGRTMSPIRWRTRDNFNNS